MPKSSSTYSLPPIVSDIVAPLPQLPIELLLSELIRRLGVRRPDLLCRLGAVVNVPIAVVPADLPHAFLISLNSDRPRVQLCDKACLPKSEVVIRAPLLELLGALDGTYEGEALFFSQDLRVEGKTEYVQALRSVLGDAELTRQELGGFSSTPTRSGSEPHARMVKRPRQAEVTSHARGTVSGGWR